MRFISAVIFFLCLFLVLASLRSYGMTMDDMSVTQKESHFISAGLSTVEEGITPSAGVAIENIPTQFRGPYPLRKQNSAYSLFIYLPQYIRFPSSFFQTITSYTSPPIYISIRLLLI